MMTPGQRRRASYEEPYLWWGPIWGSPSPRTIADLLRDDVMTPRVAALLWGMIERGASLIVAAGPSGAGKTTVLTALLDFLPPSTRRVYLRGCYESFAFADDPALDAANAVMLINEISAHLPAYLWGPGVRRAFALCRRGFRLAATAHASSIEDLIGQLASYPLLVPVSDLATLDVVVMLEASDRGNPVGRRLSGVWLVGEGADRGLTVDCLADRHNISHDLLFSSNLALPLVPSSQEIHARSRRLDQIIGEAGGDDPTTVRQLLRQPLPPDATDAPEHRGQAGEQGLPPGESRR